MFVIVGDFRLKLVLTSKQVLIEDIESEDHKRYGDYKPFNIRNCRQLSVVCLNRFKKQINKSLNNWIN
jgi:hypothetical protein